MAHFLPGSGRLALEPVGLFIQLIGHARQGAARIIVLRIAREAAAFTGAKAQEV